MECKGRRLLLFRLLKQTVRRRWLNGGAAAGEVVLGDGAGGLAVGVALRGPEGGGGA